MRPGVPPGDGDTTADDNTVAELDAATAGASPKLSSDERVTAPPPPLDYDDELNAQTVMRTLPAELFARLKRDVEAQLEPEAFDDEVTRVGSIPQMAEMTACERFSEPETVVDEAPVFARADVSKVSAARLEPAPMPRLIQLPETAPVPERASRGADLMVPPARPGRDVLPYILLGLGLGLVILLGVFYGR